MNGFVMPTERLNHDTLDAPALSASMFVDLVGEVPALFKADVDSAFRRIPVLPQHRWACGVAFKMRDTIFTAQHYACPFGAVASVHAWERVGAALTHIVRDFLKIALLRYVDDMFAPERHVHPSLSRFAWLRACIFRPDTVEHAMQCVARLTRAILGKTSIADKKLASGRCGLEILGVDMKLSAVGFQCRPSQRKVEAWCSHI